jgi:hypothetical protein
MVSPGEEPVRLMCWMHAIIKKLLVVNKQIISHPGCTEEEIQRCKSQKHFMCRDFKALHCCSSKEQFDHVCHLWYGKYVDGMLNERHNMAPRLDAFYKTYAVNGRLSLWFAGAAKDHNMNNNGLECHNRKIKETVGVAASLPNFVTNVGKYLSDNSMIRRIDDANYIPWRSELQVSAPTWTASLTMFVKLLGTGNGVSSAQYALCGNEMDGFLILSKIHHPEIFAGTKEQQEAFARPYLAALSNVSNGWMLSGCDVMALFLGQFPGFPVNVLYFYLIRP